MIWPRNLKNPQHVSAILSRPGLILSALAPVPTRAQPVIVEIGEQWPGWPLRRTQLLRTLQKLMSLQKLIAQISNLGSL